MSVNSLMELARRALHTQQTALNVVGHNIANANRTDYSRQTVSLKASTPLRYPEGILGTGVEIDSISRQRDRFIDTQLRREYGNRGNWSQREQILSQIESIFNEPSDSGMNKIMAAFWDGWQEVINNPESTAARATLQRGANHLTSRFNYLDSKLESMQTGLNAELKQKVTDINNLATEIAALNGQITSQGGAANDLLDQRDKYLDELSKIIDIDYRENANNSVTVIIDSRAIVDHITVTPLAAETQLVDEQQRESLVWADTKNAVTVDKGNVKALIDLRDNVISDYRNQLDDLALSIVEQVNAVHEAGYGLDGSTNTSFFSATTTGAGDIALSEDISDDLKKIAAGATTAPGDNDNAIALYQLRDAMIMSNDSETFEQYYNSLVSDLGALSQEAIFTNETQELIVTQVENQRQSVMGVSIDEEMVNMIKIQNAYQAATKIISMTDDLMSTIINMI